MAKESEVKSENTDLPEDVTQADVDVRLTMFNELETQIISLGSFAHSSLTSALQNLKAVL